MKYEITKEQIKQCYENPETLKTLFHDAFEIDLEAGKWYLITKNSRRGLFNFSGKFSIGDYPLGYGFGYGGGWLSFNGIGFSYDNIRPATPEEIETALIAEANKRGYEKGNYICLYNNSILETDNIYSYNATYNLLNLGSKCASVVFVDGQWAEIIEETEIELTLDEIAEKFGVDKVTIKQTKPELTIYNTYVIMESQEQCDKMKKICEVSDLPIWKDERAFIKESGINYFSCRERIKEFLVFTGYPSSCKTEVTQKEFIQILANHLIS